MIKFIKTYYLDFLVVLGTFLVSFYLVSLNGLDISLITNEGFLFTYISIFLGLSITLLSFASSMIGKIKSRIRETYYPPEKERLINRHIKNIFREIKENIYFLFISFLVIILIVVFKEFDVPYIKEYGEIMDKDRIFKSIKLTIFVLSLYSIYDLIQVSLLISDATNEVH